MPRPKKPGAPEPKRRSRNGCHACKRRKVKCDEVKPYCGGCIKSGEKCDYSMILNWGGRAQTKNEEVAQGHFTQPMGRKSSSDLSRPSTSSSSLSAYSTSLGKRRSSSDCQPARGHFGAFSMFTGSTDVDHLELPTLKRRKFSHSSSSNGMTPDLSRTTGPPTLDVAPPSMYKPPRQSPQLPVQTVMYQPSYSSACLVPQKRESIPREFDFYSMMTPDTPGFSGCPASAPVTPRHSIAGFENHLGFDAWDTPQSAMVIERRQSARGTTYGFDQGRDDLDVPRNDDDSCLKLSDPESKSRRSSSSGSSVDQAFGFGVDADISKPDTTQDSPLSQPDNLQPGYYYVRPVPVTIPTVLEPLPPTLMQNKMNLMYFHHFLNHTARCLVPHDCPENAFRTVLPKMALDNPDLLKLLLAYSANHRARLLGHELPRNRIAQYTEGLFNNMLIATQSGKPISDATLACAIMLASLDIVSPHAFEIPVPWSKHLNIAREMIQQRGGYQALRHGDKVSYFLSRWFAYLDVLGSLSGGSYERPLTDSRRSSQSSLLTSMYDGPGDSRRDDIDKDDEIDCFLGFTGRCIGMLAEAANLAKDCDEKRRRHEAETNSPDHWTPSEADKQRAQPLLYYLSHRNPVLYRGCSHREVQIDQPDLMVNNAFHHAGLIHIFRRVLGHDAESVDVQREVSNIRQCLNEVDERSISCMIFPVFTAACEARNDLDRTCFLTAMLKVERMGMAQAKKSKEVMEKVWQTGHPWWVLVRNPHMTGAFVG